MTMQDLKAAAQRVACLHAAAAVEAAGDQPVKFAGTSQIACWLKRTVFASCAATVLMLQEHNDLI